MDNSEGPMKLMATHISNLTDARYFAARMVDYMVFDPALLHVDAISTIKEIQGWIDGVTWVLHGTTATDALHFIMEETNISAGLSADSLFLRHFSDQFLLSDGEVVAPGGTWLTLRNKVPDSNMLRNYVGLVISGSGEEKVGFKSFDELDLLFDQIEALTQ